MLDVYMLIEPSYLDELAIGRITGLFFQLYHNQQFDVKLKGVYFIENILPKVWFLSFILSTSSFFSTP